MSSVTAVPLAPVKRGYVIWLWVGILLAIGAAAALAGAGSNWHVTRDGLGYQRLKEGTGASHPTDGDIVLVNYEGRLTDGTIFDKSQQPTPLPVMQMVKGFGEGLKLMTKGSRFRFRVPPKLGYGDAPPPGSPIKATSTLIFDVELVDFLPEAQVRAIQQQQMQTQLGQGRSLSTGRPGE